MKFEMPYGYRHLTGDEYAEYMFADDFRFGWLNHVEIHGSPVVEEHYIRPWDCMIEFGMDHDHDPAECESMMHRMTVDSVIDSVFDDHDHYERFGRPAFPNEY